MDNNKIKIVHLVNGLRHDGSGKVVLQLCKLFNDNKHEVAVVSLTPNVELTLSGEWPEEVDVFTFNYQYDNNYSLRHYFRLWLNKDITLKKSADIMKCITELRPDILQCHLQPRELLMTQNFDDSRLLYTDHSVRIKQSQYNAINTKLLAFIYRQILRRFHVIAVSERVKHCHEFFGLVKKSRIHKLIVNGIDTEKYQPVPKAETPLKILYIARLDKRKDQRVLIKAWKLLDSKKSIQLVLVGDGDERTTLELMISKLNPANEIVFTGATNDVLPYLNAAHIGVFPSLQEGLPLSLLEKMSCGLPVVASNIDEFDGIIQNEKNGLSFKVGDESDLADKLGRLIEDETLRVKLGEEARRFVIEHYDHRQLKDAYDAVYQEMMNRQNAKF